MAVNTSSLAIMGSDCPPGQPYIHGTNISLSLHFDDTKEQDRVWTALSEGGKAIMPMGAQFWGARFGIAGRHVWHALAA